MSEETHVIAREDAVKTITKLNYGVGASSVQMQEFVFNAILFFFTSTSSGCLQPLPALPPLFR